MEHEIDIVGGLRPDQPLSMKVQGQLVIETGIPDADAVIAEKFRRVEREVFELLNVLAAPVSGVVGAPLDRATR